MAKELRHPFETFGPAPYRIVRIEEKVHVIPGVMVKAAGSCDVCMTSIRWAYTVRAGNGVEFITGCDCAEKCGMTAKELRDARRSYVRERNAAERRAHRAAAEAAERSGNPLGLTRREMTQATVAGEQAARLWLEAERKAEAQHTGIVGKRARGLELRVDHIASWEGYYGITYLYIMRDRAGNAYTWKTSASLGFDGPDGWQRVSEIDRDEPRKSAWFVCDATVKAHTVYEGLRQTVLARVKVKSVGDTFEVVRNTRYLRAA